MAKAVPAGGAALGLSAARTGPAAMGAQHSRPQAATLFRDLSHIRQRENRMNQAVGFLAALCSTLSFAPQAWKIIQSRDTKSISTGMYLLTVVGFALWLAFGILGRQWPLMLSNGICLLL